MEEYISREAAIKIIREEGIYGFGYSDTEREDDVIRILESVPPAKVRLLMEGHWIAQEIKGNRRGTVRRLCSNCGANNLNRKSNYCPNCGARMK